MGYSGLNLASGISLRPYGNAGGGSDPDFASVTALYGFEDANFTSGVHNDGSAGNATVQSSGVAPTTAAFVAGAQSAAFNQTGATSNNGLTLGTTGAIIGGGNFTIEGFIRDPAAAFFQLWSSGVDGFSTNRLNLDFPSSRAVSVVFDNATTRTSATGVWPAGAFFHYAFVFDTGPAFRVYVNGTLVLSGTDTFGRSGNANLAHHVFTAAPISGPQYLDEFRVTTLARYSGSSFPVPSVPFPRS